MSESGGNLELRKFIAEYIGDDICAAKSGNALQNHALDSLTAIQLANQLFAHFGLHIHPDDLSEKSLEKLLEQIGGQAAFCRERRPTQSTIFAGNKTQTTSATLNGPVLGEKAAATTRSGGSSFAASILDPFDILSRSDRIYAKAARESGFADFWNQVAPIENDLVVAFVLEAFTDLGIDLSQLPRGAMVPRIPHLPQYDQLVQRIVEILEDRHVVEVYKGTIIRGSGCVDNASSSTLCEFLLTEHPQLECEVKLLGLVGPQLANCMTGKANPISVLFSSTESRQIMENFYREAPMMGAHVEQLVFFITTLLQEVPASPSKPVQILEVGGGTGGTTARVLHVVEAHDCPVQYTFTDIGPSFVKQARIKWGQTPWLQFALLNIEQEVSQSFREKYDVVIGANVVHATTDRVAACRRLRGTLRPGGLLVLSEVTRVIDWFDICFGLLEGWWLAEGGKGRAIQPAAIWIDALRKAGFESVGHSVGDGSEEACSQQLLVARKGMT